MSATALRHPEPLETQFATDLADNQVAEADPFAPYQRDEELEWQDVSAHVPTFTDTPSAEEVEKRRKNALRNRHFRLSLPFLAGLLVFAQLLGLVYLYSLDLKLTRQASKLDESIRQTRLQISLTQSKMAASKSTPHLTQWAAQLGYREAQMADMDDVTSSARFVPAKSKMEKPKTEGAR